MFRIYPAVIGLTCALFVSLPLDASAQEESSNDGAARVHYDAGRLYYDAERYDEALREFQEAYRLSPRPALLYNQASALDRLERVEEAIALYQLYVDTDQDSPLRPEILERIAALRTAQNTSADEGSTSPEVTEPGEPESNGHRSGPTWAWVNFGVGGALMAAAITTGVLALGVHGDLTEECGEGTPCPAHLESDISRGERLTLITDILGALALIATAAGVTLWVLHDDTSEGTGASLTASFGGLHLEVGF